MPGVSGYHGDPYPGGGGEMYPGSSRYDGYDPYGAGHSQNMAGPREDPYNYSRHVGRDPKSGREDPYLGRATGPVDDPYSRQRAPYDPYAARKPEEFHHQRPVDDQPYARVRKDKHQNGALAAARDDYRTYPPEPDIAASSFPHYEMDHLATFKVDPKQGIMSPTDGIRKIRQMELSSGIWTMRVTLIIEPQDVIVIDRASGEAIEQFPVVAISQPTAVTNEDRRDVYNNIVLFTVTEETRRGPQSEMHLFQCRGRAAHEVVDDIKAAKAGRIRGSAPRRDPDYPVVSDAIRDFEQYAEHNYNAMRDYHQDVQSTQLLRQSMRRDDNESVLSDRTDHEVSKGADSDEKTKEPEEHKEGRHESDDYDISKLTLEETQQLLNHCFDDIEKFVAHLQSAAEAYRELDYRRKQRGKKNKQPIGEGMLSMRSRPPPANAFIDVFQKFKLSFNLLARLKPHIHDPNAPELVHFLFTPLALVVEASKDPRHRSPDIASRVVSPMLTAEAKELLMNCLSSKEMNLWYSLGDAWKLSRDEYPGHVPPYHPRFSDGWEPPRSWNVDENHANSLHYHDHEEPYRRGGNGYAGPPVKEESPYRPPPKDAHAMALKEYEQEYNRRQKRRMEADMTDPGQLDDSRRHDFDDVVGSSRHSTEPLTFEEEQQNFLQQLRERNAKVAEVIHPRQGKNNKELSLQKGEYVEVLDTSRNWWKARNSKGEVGHAPYTILREMSHSQTSQQDSKAHSDRRSVNETNLKSPYNPPYSAAEDVPIPPKGQQPSASSGDYYARRSYDLKILGLSTPEAC